MVSNTALNSETIHDCKGRPIDRDAATVLKAIDQLLTVGAYYSVDHDQYRVVSEKSCAQITEAIGKGKVMTVEVTATGMMVRSQLVDPHHRNVRLLHDLLVPLNIARLEISANLTPEDLRQAIHALQQHRQLLGHTTGFQEIKIENLPASVNIASRGVVQGAGGKDEDTGGSGLGNLDDVLGDRSSPGNGPLPDHPESECEKLAREFMDIVGRILDNLEQAEPDPNDPEAALQSESTPENIRTLRKALRRLVEVNPDPGDLARLIEHAKRALDLSRDPASVDLVFNLLRREVERDGDWKYKASENAKSQPRKEYLLDLEELRSEVSSLEAHGHLPEEPEPSSLSNHLGICFHMLGSNPSRSLAGSLVSSLENILGGREISRRDLDLCCAAVANSALNDGQVSLDIVLPALCNPLRVSRPDYLVKFWTGLWETLDTGRRALVWPHLVSDLWRGFGETPPEITEKLWLMAAQIKPEAIIRQVSRLECTPALREKTACSSLMKLPLETMYPVHLALMKSSLASAHGARLHECLYRRPPNGLTEVLVRALKQYDSAHNGFYLALIKHGSGTSITPELRRMSARILFDGLTELTPQERNGNWVPKALGWLTKLDSAMALPLLTRVRDQRRYLFFKAWPADCRKLAEKIISGAKTDTADRDRG